MKIVKKYLDKVKKKARKTCGHLFLFFTFLKLSENFMYLYKVFYLYSAHSVSALSKTFPFQLYVLNFCFALFLKITH